MGESDRCAKSWSDVVEVDVDLTQQATRLRRGFLAERPPDALDELRGASLREAHTGDGRAEIRMTFHDGCRAR